MKIMTGLFLCMMFYGSLWAENPARVCYSQEAARCVICKEPLSSFDYLTLGPDTTICHACFEHQRPLEKDSFVPFGKQSPEPGGSLSSGDGSGFSDAYYHDPRCRELIRNCDPFVSVVDTSAKTTKKKKRRPARSKAVIVFRFPIMGQRPVKLDKSETPEPVKECLEDDSLTFWGYETFSRDGNYFLRANNPALQGGQVSDGWEIPITQVWSNGVQSVIETQDGYFFNNSATYEKKYFDTTEKNDLAKYLQEQGYDFTFNVTLLPVGSFLEALVGKATKEKQIQEKEDNDIPTYAYYRYPYSADTVLERVAQKSSSLLSDDDKKWAYIYKSGSGVIEAHAAQKVTQTRALDLSLEKMWKKGPLLFALSKDTLVLINFETQDKDIFCTPTRSVLEQITDQKMSVLGFEPVTVPASEKDSLRSVQPKSVPEMDTLKVE